MVWQSVGVSWWMVSGNKGSGGALEGGQVGDLVVGLVGGQGAV